MGERSARARVNPVEVEELAATPGEVAEFNFADEMFEGGRTREKLSKSQR